MGEHGRLVWEDDRLLQERSSASALEFIRDNTIRFGVPTSVREELPMPVALADPHARLLENFTAAVRGAAELRVPGEAGESAVELVNAAVMAMQRRTVVPLPLDAAVYDAWLAERIARAASEFERNGTPIDAF